MHVAVVDLGTNTAILLIAQINANQTFQVLHDECRIVRLGQDIKKNCFFLPQAMKRAIEALTDYQQIIQKFKCSECTLVGTASFRNASNTTEFLDLIKKSNLNFNVRVLSGDEEAQIIHPSAVKDFEHLQKPFLVLDIGGGSTELIFDDALQIKRVSLPFGAVSLTEDFFNSDPPTQSQIIALLNYIKGKLPLHHFQMQPNQVEHPKLIATAGTPTTLYALNKHLKQYDSTKVHGQLMTLNELTTMIHHLKSKTFKERCQIPCLEPGRADVIIAGSLILETVMQSYKFNDFWISDRGLRYGVLYNIIASYK